jgi:hypothetical protein
MDDSSNLNPLFQDTIRDMYGDVSRSQSRSGSPSELEKAYNKLDEELGGYLPGGAESPLGRFSRGTKQAVDRAYGQLDKNIFRGFLPGGAESLYGKVRRQVGDAPASAPVAEQTLPVTSQAKNTTQPTPTTQPTSPLPGNQPSNTTNQLGGLVNVLRTEIEERGRRQDRITSPEYLDAAMRRRQQELAYATDLLSKAQMGQMREKTRRDVLDGWRKIQQEKIRANTVMATALMNTSILAATPNTGVIQALSGPTQAAIQAFRPGQAVN